MIQEEIKEIAAMPRIRPAKFKHHHRWPVIWKAWNRFIAFVYNVWPRS